VQVKFTLGHTIKSQRGSKGTVLHYPLFVSFIHFKFYITVHMYIYLFIYMCVYYTLIYFEVVLVIL